MAAPPEDPKEPFSHSVGVGEELASSDGLVLRFIRRMLMEEEDSDSDNILYQQYCPDHPAAALLQAEQPFAQILSSGSSAATYSSPHNADATWPYDPDEHEPSQLQLQHGVGEGASAFFNGGDAAIQFQFQDAAAGDGVITMDMLNQAFLKGVEEANKFLPTATNNNILQPRDSDSELPGVCFASKQRQRVVDGKRMPAITFQEISSGNGRGRRGCQDYLEAEAEDAAARRSKLIAPEPDGSGEVADAVFHKAYEVAMQKMHGLSISSSVPVPPPPPPPRTRGRQQPRNNNSNHDEAVDLRTLLIHCAEAVSAGNRLSATELLRQINQRSSPMGDASQRLAHCLAQGLQLRLTGMGVAKPQRTSGVELLKAHLLYMQVCCFRMVAFKFSHMAISQAVAGRKKVHIVDYGVHLGFHWLLLLGAWAAREGGPPEVRITGIDFPQPGFRPAARIKDTECRLNDFARKHGIPFMFRSIMATKWEMVSAEELDIQPDEVLVVNGLFHFQKLMDEGVADIRTPSPRDTVLVNIRKMRPDVFILCIENSSYNTPFFVTRFRETLYYYSAMFDMMDATAPRDSVERMVVEKEFLGRCALNAIACEGLEREERPETYKQWHVRCSKVGLTQLPLNPGTTKSLRNRVDEGYHQNFVIDEDQQWLLQGWKGRILYAMSTWAADR